MDNTKEIRKLAWDIIPCPNVRDFMPLLGLVPGSDDVNEMEHAESHRRLDRLAPLVDVIEDQCHAAAHVVTACMLRLDIDDAEEGVEEQVVVQNASVLHAGMVAILAQLLDDGTLVIGKMPRV